MKTRNANANGKVLPLECAVFDARLQQAGLTLADVAKRSGLDPEYLRQQRSRGFPVKLARYRLEAALGFEIPIWSDRRELLLRRKCVALHGLDPFTATKEEMMRLVTLLDIPLINDARQYSEKLAERLLEYVSCSSRSTVSPPPR